MYNNYYAHIPLTFVSGIAGAKSFIVAPNQTVYLKDSEADVLYIKTADAQGRYSLKAYNLVPMEPDQQKYVTLEDLKALEERLTKAFGGTHESN